MKRALLSYFFKRDLNAIHAAGGGLAAIYIVEGHFLRAVVAIVIGIAVSVIGEIALEKSA